MMTPGQYTARQIDLLFRAEADRVSVFEDTDSVRSPGWYKAQCYQDGINPWETSGTESVVSDAVREHVARDHPLARLLAAVSDAVREGGDKLLALPQELGRIWAANDDHPASEAMRRQLDPNDLWGVYQYRLVDASGMEMGQASGRFLDAMQQLGGVVGAARIERRTSDGEAWQLLTEIPAKGA
jgi:hypothetical protein